jgi:predicted ATP-dependent serine protease
MSPSLAGIKRMVAEHNPSILVIDTSEGITVDNTQGDAFKQQTGLAMGLRDLARDMGVIVIMVHHLHKGAGGDRQGQLTMDSAKGSSAIVQQADKILAVEGEVSLPLRYVRSLAARDEGQMEMQFNFDHERMQWIQI